MPHFEALKIYSFGQHCEKRRNCLLQAISPFLTTFCTLYGSYFPFYMNLNPFPNKPWFLRVCSTTLLKSPWEKEKLLLTSNFSFFPQCFLPIWRTFFHFHQILNCHLLTLSIWRSRKFVVWDRVKMSSAICFSLDQSKILSSGNGLRSKPHDIKQSNQYTTSVSNFI